uniref:SSD domain-containing protein n=1 Tax=Meloidogyne incognita TaxID=6306 RepID=A0A914LR37_MELIC
MNNIPSNIPQVGNVEGKLKNKILRNKACSDETLFVGILNAVFRKFGQIISIHPWLFIGTSLLLTIFCSLKIPFTKMTNDVADFTPYGARARKESGVYEAFFSNKGDPVVLFVLITAKRKGGNMLGVHELEDTVQLLNIVNDQFKVEDIQKNNNLSFSDFCDNFCTINEPVRHFHSGLLLERNFGNSSLDHIDLGYPITTVLGRQLHMDPHFFGVKIAVPFNKTNKNNSEINNQIISVNELKNNSFKNVLKSSSFHYSLLTSNFSQIPNNIREIKLICLYFRAVRPKGVSKEAMQNWQRQISHFVRNEFKSDFVDAHILSETILTDEVVRAGLTLLPFLIIGFVIMVIFSSITMSAAAYYMGQLGAHKILLAIVACCCPFMACGTALGGMFWFGFRFGSLLCVTPFLVLALGVDDAYLLLNSWQRLRKKMEKNIKKQLDIEEKEENNFEKEKEEEQKLIQKLMGDVMVDTGASITITTLTNVLAFAIGAFTPTPEIRLFSIGNAIAITIVYIYQWTVFGPAIALFGYKELNKILKEIKKKIKKQKIINNNSNSLSISSFSSFSSETDSGINVKEEEYFDEDIKISENNKRKTIKKRKEGMAKILRRLIQKYCKRFLRFYCHSLKNNCVAFGVFLLLFLYVCISLYGLFGIRAELKPEQLFLRSSDIQEILRIRDLYIMPFYAVCLVFVNRPGNFSEPTQRMKWHSLVADFEALPSSVGSFSTKFWLRDYEQFVESDNNDESAPLDDLVSFEGITPDERRKNELTEFLEWPEFQFWNGFIQLIRPFNSSSEPQLKRFFFSTASFGEELKEWSKREELLEHWRRVADSYPELEVSVFEDEAKFLDLIPTMIPQTLQSTICTLICMFFVCLLFMKNIPSLAISNFAIFFTCIGVFGIQSLMGTALDPIFMSAAIMSIGFSVDIPAHIVYHFYKTGVSEGNENKLIKNVEERLLDCLASIAFPILEAGLSTLICVSSLFLVDLHMARVFARTMTLVVIIGLLQGLLVIPTMLCQFSRQKSLQNNENNKVAPIVLAVNE